MHPVVFFRHNLNRKLLFIIGATKGKLGGIINVCSHCPYSTPVLSHFKRHLLIHSGKRPFSCEMCSKSFRQKEHLKSHLLTHMIQCSICFQTFTCKEDLKTHMSTVHFL